MTNQFMRDCQAVLTVLSQHGECGQATIKLHAGEFDNLGRVLEALIQEGRIVATGQSVMMYRLVERKINRPSHRFEHQNLEGWRKGEMIIMTSGTGKSRMPPLEHTGTNHDIAIKPGVAVETFNNLGLDKGYNPQPIEWYPPKNRKTPGVYVTIESTPWYEQYPYEEWQSVVANGDTRLGYEEWTQDRIKATRPAHNEMLSE